MPRVRPHHIAALTGVIAAAGLIALKYDRDIRRAQLAAILGSRVVDTDAGPVEFVESGKGFPLFSIHGAGGGYDQGLAIVAGLVGNGFRVIAPSRFGYLQTPVPTDTSAEAQADAHFALLNRLDVDKAIVVGTSAGAVSAVEFALRHPERTAALILIVPGTYSPTTPVRVDPSRSSTIALWLVNHGADFTWWALEKLAPAMLMRFAGVRPEIFAGASKAERIRAKELLGTMQPLSPRLAGIAIDSKADLHPLPLEKITAPTLIISARDDLFNTLPAAEYAAEHIPHAELVVYDSGGHFLMGKNSQVRAVIQGFLSGLNLIPRLHRIEDVTASAA